MEYNIVLSQNNEFEQSRKLKLVKENLTAYLSILDEVIFSFKYFDMEEDKDVS